MMRDDEYYKDLIASLNDANDPMDEADIDKLIAFVKSVGDKTDEDGELDDAYETMSPEDFLAKALGESDGEDDEADYSEDEGGEGDDYKDDEGDDSVGGDAEDGDAGGGIPDGAEKPDSSVSDKKETVSDENVKNVGKRKRGRPPKRRGDAQDGTQADIARALADLRF